MTIAEALKLGIPVTNGPRHGIPGPAVARILIDGGWQFGSFERADADRIAQSIVQSELRTMVARHGTIGGSR